MKKFVNIIVLILAILIIIFAVQNYMVTTVKVFFWNINGSLSIILLLVLLIGYLIGYFSCLPLVFRRRKQIKEMEKKLKIIEGKNNTEG